MALNIKDLLLLPSLEKFTLVAGSAGLDNTVISAGIVDYEFSKGLKYTNDVLFEDKSFVITSLLFAQNDPSAILPAVKTLREYGVSALAYKDVFYERLPDEVIDYANEEAFPIFAFGNNIFFEAVIYDIMSAVQSDDNTYLTEDNITAMITCTMGKPKALDIVRRLSLKFNKHISIAYLVPKSQNDDFDLNRIYRNYYVSKTLKSKVIVAKYNDGIFIVTTSNKDDKKSHDIILREALDTLSIDIDKLTVSFSDILSPFEDFDLAFRESFYASIGARIMNVGKLDYSSLGALRLLIPLSDDSSSLEFSDYYLSKFADNREYYDTAINYIKNGGDMAATAVEMSCHINTIRYRLSKIRELTGDTNISEYEFYENLSLAITIMNIRQVKTYFARNDLPYDNPPQHK